MRVASAVRELRRHGTDLTWWRKRFLTHVVGRYYRAIGGNTGTPVVELDWDNLLILDACRYDLFEEVYNDRALPGEFTARNSVATGTPAFLAANFGEGNFHDTVYVTANPYVETELPAGTFHAVDSVWQDRWDHDMQTVTPETMYEAALAAAEAYPQKRLIVHFMQPHAPFIGEVQLETEHRKTFAIRERALGEERATRAGYRTPFERLERGELSREDVWAAYRSNLKRAWPAVERLLDELAGRTGVTADHGNALGEFATPFPIRVYGHPLGITIPALTQVPWLVHQPAGRRKVVAEPPDARSEVDRDTEARLRQLGYTE